MSDCGCTCTPNPDEVKSLVQSYLYSEINAGNLQPPLTGTDGSRLGAAVVMTAAEVRSAIGDVKTDLQHQIDDVVAAQKNFADQIPNMLTAVSHDGSLDGDGTKASPLTIDQAWLKNTVGATLGIDGGVVASTITENGDLPTSIVGDTTAVLGKPAGFIPHPTLTGFGIPVYATKRL